MQEYETFLRDRRDKHKGGEYSGSGLIKSMGGLGNVLTFGRSGKKEIFDERILGSGDFVETILKEAGKLPESKVLPQEIMRQVCEMTGVSKKEVVGGSQVRKVVQARAGEREGQNPRGGLDEGVRANLRGDIKTC